MIVFLYRGCFYKYFYVPSTYKYTQTARPVTTISVGLTNKYLFICN